jgi:choline dehydrogenase
MYDYVIVGAGSAGCVLAARLSEDPGVSVCLVEAGGSDGDPNISVPAAAAKLFRSRYDWDYDTHHETQCDDRRIYLPKGRGLGGTSSLNGMIYTRGHRHDYDSWHQPGWTYEELLPYFLRSEDNERGASAHHGTGGPLAVSDGRSRNPMATAFVDAAVEAGYSRNDDFNGTRQDGFGPYQVTQRDGVRCSSAAAYLHPALDRPNLTVETHVSVHRITMSGDRATGIVGRRLDEELEIRAEREVIVAAGAYASPQLLMLSGIGPADHLRAFGLPVRVDQPLVGRNLQDHPQFWLVWGHDEPVSLLAAGSEDSRMRYLADRTGPLSSNGPEAGGFTRSRPGLPAPDLQFTCLPVMYVEGGLGAPTGHAISAGGYVLRPRSRGSVTLAGDDPSVKPRIVHDYYADETDLDVAVAGVRTVLELAAQRSLKPYTTRPVSVPESAGDADVRAFLRRTTQSSYHAAGTCAMGLVTDAELRVLGVEGLRVVDASVMPALVSGNTNAPTIAIAEKAADLVKGAAPLSRMPAAATV